MTNPAAQLLLSGSIDLAQDELERITGSKRARDQVAWLDSKQWKYELTKGREPVVGRWYATMRLAGITPQAATAQAWAPDFTGVRG